MNKIFLVATLLLGTSLFMACGDQSAGNKPANVAGNNANRPPAASPSPPASVPTATPMISSNTATPSDSKTKVNPPKAVKEAETALDDSAPKPKASPKKP